METKFLSLILLTAILLSATASANVAFTTSTSSVVFTQAMDSVEFTVTNTGDETTDFTMPIGITLTDGTNNVAVTLDKFSFTLAEGESQIITASVNPEELDDLETGIYSTSVDIEAAGSENLTKSMSFKAKKSYCELGPVNESLIDIRDVEESGSSESDDWTWRPQDEITLEVRVTNNDDDDREFVVEWDIYDTEDEEFLDVGDDDEIDVDEDDSEWVEFTFDVPSELEQGGRYILYIKAYDDDDGEEEICTVVGDNGRSADLEDVEGIPLDIERERNEVIVSKTDIPDLLSCDSTTDIELWIANIGREREEEIKVTLLESVFGNEISREISNLDWDDDPERVSFPITIPKDLEEGSYSLKFKIEFEYDEDDDEYDDFVTDSFNIEVRGNCQVEEDLDALITAVLDSGAVEGNELVIKGTLKNTGEEKTDYVTSVMDHNSWATLDNIEPRILSLDAGESEEFFIYFTVDDDAAGEQFFTIRADFGDESEEQEVSVVIEESEDEETAPVTGNVIADSLRENWFIWLIVVINVILIVAIILVARRIVTSK